MNAYGARARAGLAVAAHVAAPRQADPELLELFEESGRNVQRASALLRDLLADYPERRARARHPATASTRATGSRTTSSTASACAGTGAPLDAADVHALAGALDDVVDYAEEAADQLGLYGVEAPMEQAAGDRRRARRVPPSRSPPRCAALRDGTDLGRTWSRSTGSRTRRDRLSAPPSRRCSPPASTR